MTEAALVLFIWCGLGFTGWHIIGDKREPGGLMLLTYLGPFSFLLAAITVLFNTHVDYSIPKERLTPEEKAARYEAQRQLWLLQTNGGDDAK